MLPLRREDILCENTNIAVFPECLTTELTLIAPDEILWSHKRACYKRCAEVWGDDCSLKIPLFSGVRSGTAIACRRWPIGCTRTKSVERMISISNSEKYWLFAIQIFFNSFLISLNFVIYYECLFYSKCKTLDDFFTNLGVMISLLV